MHIRTIKGFRRLCDFGQEPSWRLGQYPHTVIWNQSVNGPLSELPASPTPFTLSAGTNSVIATVGGGSGETGINQNWVNINIPAGLQLNNLVLAAYSSTDQQGFTGVASGASFAGGESAVNVAASYLGYVHFGTGATNGSLPPTNLVGVDVLPLMGNKATISPRFRGFHAPAPCWRLHLSDSAVRCYDKLPIRLRRDRGP